MKIKSIILIFFLSISILSISICIIKISTSTAKTPIEKFSWPIFRGDRKLSGICKSHLPDNPQLLWSKKIGEEIKSSPVIGDGRIFIGSDDGCVYALSLADGKEIWKFSTKDMIEASPLLVDHTLYIGSMEGVLYALSAQDGKLKWKFTIGSRIVGSANWIDKQDGGAQRILIGSYDNNIYCLDLISGKKVWSYKTDNYINCTPSVDKGKIVFGGCDAKIHVVSQSDGRAIGVIDTGSYIAGSVALSNNYAFVGNYGNKFMCIDLIKKKILWEYGDEKKGAPFFSSPAISRDKAIIGCRDNFLYCINPKNGKMIWRFKSRDEIDSSPIICDDKVVVGSNDGRLYIVNLIDGKMIWSYEIGAAITSSPAVDSNIIVISAEDGSVYAFGSKKIGSKKR